MKYLCLIFLIYFPVVYGESRCSLCGFWQSNEELTRKSYLSMQDISESLRDKVVGDPFNIFGDDVLYFEQGHLTYLNTLHSTASVDVLSRKNGLLVIELTQLIPEVGSGQKLIWEVSFEGVCFRVKTLKDREYFYRYYCPSTENVYNQALQRLSR